MNVKPLSRTAILFALLAAPGAMAAPAIVADLDSGKVIYSQQATEPWFPASITKLMTAYVVFGAIESGKISLDTPFTVSERALAQPPSKIGVKTGLQVTVDNALKMLMVKSANDMAVLLAEGVGGSVEGFSEMMNAEAKRLGMRESRFVNPHGLPDEGNRTSARDMAVLARALYKDFPKYQGYFSIDAIKLGRAVMRNHNGLMGRYPGTDGMKTGFICSSGFNVVATATRGGKRIVVVVLGSPNATERTIKAANLFDRGFGDSWGGSGTLEALPASDKATPIDLRDQICGKNRNRGESEEEMPTPVEAGSFSENPLLSLFGKASPAAGTVVGANGKGLSPRAAYVPINVFVGATAATAVADAVVLGKGRKGKRKRTAVARAGKADAKQQTAKAAANQAAAAKPDGGKAKAAAPKSGAGDKSATKPKAKAKSAALDVKPKAQAAGGIQQR
jgi:D-alanyl-D-alanine carboxypeptidase